MKALVTGGTGFTGSRLSERLLEQGHEVTILDNQKGHSVPRLDALGAKIVLSSVTDQEAVSKAVEGCDVVFHLAAAFRQINLPDQVYWDVNVEGTRNVLLASQKHGVKKVVYCSTCGVHGHIQNPPAGEEAPIAPADYYQYTKYEGEKVVREFQDMGLETVIIRPTAIYGPGDPERFLMLFKFVERGRFLMFGNGRTHYHPVFIDNLVDAFLLVAEPGVGKGQVFLIGDQKSCSLEELVGQVGKSLGIQVKISHLPFWPLWLAAASCELLFKPLKKDPPLFRRRVDWYRQNRSFDISKATREVGYRPRISLAEGLARTAEWYRQNGYLSDATIESKTLDAPQS